MQKTFSKNEIDEVAKDILAALQPKESAAVVALSGDLGAGKTTLTQSIGRALGISENMISPTFVIMKIYDLPSKPPIVPGISRLVHIDAYRLNSSEELKKLGWDELVNNPKNLILIEWPERVPECIPEDAYSINLAHINEDTRSIHS